MFFIAVGLTADLVWRAPEEEICPKTLTRHRPDDDPHEAWSKLLTRGLAYIGAVRDPYERAAGLYQEF